MPSDTLLPNADEKPTYVNHMFARIAPTYDLMNRLMTFGQDQGWRRLLLDLADLPPHGRLLDVGTGTGDIAYAALARHPGLAAVGVDFTYEMMAAGVNKAPGLRVPFAQADTFHLPYPAGTFDAVVSGFLLRNVVDRVAALREQTRVTRPGGRVLVLETAPPHTTLLGPLFQLYFFRVVPLLGRLVSGDATAYAYLPRSTVAFPEAEAFAREMEQAGLHNVIYRKLMFGAVTIHLGHK